ncbi:squalene/phytoene synthase family protein [Sandaracinobacteroides saxicola]|uniref:Squalene/phytoene synthase family protein n=1 Tax=Sandaracinobacteroides saxicola TaxID=2759707 RepID=A0A7G5IHL8_9SPHN|nr:squalene/phytoene synthase family protein [Sandaracinobacteroides saxicola]QMW22860.1 squalene/phytoene synthase family protein [Sandaracinobacteroides saxicola]
MMDRDHRIIALWLPAPARAVFQAVTAFDAELARVATGAKEPMLGAIRLAWWRERVEDLANGRDAPAQPILAALAAVRAQVDLRLLAQLDEAWLPLLEEGVADWAGHAAVRGRLLFAALGEAGAFGAAAGASWAAGEVARGALGAAAGEPVLASLRHLATPPRTTEGAARALLALARLGARDLARAVAGRGVEPRGTAGRQWLIARTMLAG